MGFGSLVSKGLSAASAVKSKISEIKSGIKSIGYSRRYNWTNL